MPVGGHQFGAVACPCNASLIRASTCQEVPSELLRVQVLEFSDEAKWAAVEVDAAPWPEAPSLLTSRRGSFSVSISRASSQTSTRHQIGTMPSGIPAVSTALERVRPTDSLICVLAANPRVKMSTSSLQVSLWILCGFAGRGVARHFFECSSANQIALQSASVMD